MVQIRFAGSRASSSPLCASKAPHKEKIKCHRQEGNTRRKNNGNASPLPFLFVHSTMSRLDESFIAPGSNNRNNSSGGSSDFFSPISLAFFGKDVLPRSHDTSWIGARQSPIPSFDREDDEEEDDEEANRATEIYHRALHESLEAAEFVNERTSLLHKRRAAASMAAQQAPIHPLWNGATPEERMMNEQKSACRIFWGDLLIIVSGIHLSAISAYEINLWLSDKNVGMVLTWMSILLPRSSQILLMAGALDAERVLIYGEYWRILSSLFVCPSLLNWFIVLIGWVLVYSARRQNTLLSWYSWLGTWFASALVGLLWMMAWDLRIRPVVGCNLWGTAGVLTSVGIHRPQERWWHFLLCALAVVLSWWEQPCNSVYGVLGASFFGWGLGAATRGTQSLAEKGHSPSGLSYASVAVVLFMVLAPVLSIAFLGTNIPFLS